MAYRSSVEESTGCSPNLLRENNSPIDLIIGNPLSNPNPVCPVEYVEWLRNTLENTHQSAHENLKHAAAKQKYYDRGFKTYNVELTKATLCGDDIPLQQELNQDKNHRCDL